jgi:hypothetical protein
MGTTVNGLPYPEPSDPIAAGAAAIRSLAEKLQITGGRVTMTGGANSEAQTVTFPVGLFTSAPTVVAETASTYTTCATGSASTSSVAISMIYRTGAGTITTLPANVWSQWIAIAVQ